MSDIEVALASPTVFTTFNIFVNNVKMDEQLCLTFDQARELIKQLESVLPKGEDE